MDMPRRDPITVRPPAFQPVAEFLARVIPGDCARTRLFREQLLDFACTPTVRTLFMTSVGGDGIPLARLVALLRTAMLLNPQAAARRLEAARTTPGGLADYRQLTGFFAELDASAMREQDVMQELLGRPAASGGVRPGLFERAMLLNGVRTEDADLTGGFVHVAEPGDLTGAAQAALAGLSSGAPFPPLGESEEGETYLAFEGVTICTTRRGSGSDGLRSDVAARLTGHEIAVPKLSELTTEFGLQADLALQRVKADYERFVGRATLASDAAREFWRENGPPARLPPQTKTLLAAVDWSRHGEGEGLLQAVRAIARGAPPTEVVGALTQAAPPTPRDPADVLLRRLESSSGHGDRKLAGRIRAIELETRAALKKRLRSDRAAAARLARVLGLTTEALAVQVGQLDRTRSVGKSDGSR